MTLKSLKQMKNKNIFLDLLIIIGIFVFVLGYVIDIQETKKLLEVETASAPEKIIVVEDNTEYFAAELEYAKEVINHKDEIINALADELNAKNSGKAAIIKEIKQSQLELKTRIKPTLAQLNQIESWLMTKDSIPSKEEFYSYLEHQVFSPAQYQEYLEYERDLEYSERLRTLSDVVKIVKLDNEALDSFCNHNFPTNEEALAAILSEDQLKLWEEYNK